VFGRQLGPAVTSARQLLSLEDNVSDVRAFIERYERTYGNEHVPFTAVSYKQVRFFYFYASNNRYCSFGFS
jgi:hypothetical protein